MVEFTYKNQSPDDSVKVIGESPTMVSVELQDINPLQRNCPDAKTFFDYFESGTPPEDPKAAKKLVIESEFYEIIDGRMHHFHHPRDKGVNQ